MTASDYPITEEYGWQISYPLHTSPADPAVPPNERGNYPGTGYGFHTGRDWGCSMGTPIVVNGVQIGLSGNTGETFGPHVHVGRYVGGVATNPETPWVFNSAVVTEIGEDATNGKYVRVQADGASYVYLHMSQQTATKGQVLKGGRMYTDDQINQMFNDRDKRMDKDEANVSRLYQTVDDNGKKLDDDIANLGRLYPTVDDINQRVKKLETNSNPTGGDYHLQPLGDK